jgi:hypothetical protein
VHAAACCGLQRPEHARLVRIGVAFGHVGVALFLDQHPFAGEQLHRPRDDSVQHRLQRFAGGRLNFHEDRRAVGVAAVHAIKHQAVQVNVQVGR